MGALIPRRRLVVAAAVLGAGAAVLPTTAPAETVEPVTPVVVEGCAPQDHPGGEWRSYGHDQANTRTQPKETTIGAVEAATLAPVWTLSMVEATGDPAAGDVTGTPVVADGCLFVGTNGGHVVAANADSGEPVWSTPMPRGGQVNGSVTVLEGVVYAAVSNVSRGQSCAGDDCAGPYVVALEETTGAPLWTSAPLDTQPGADVYASPVIVDGALMLGVSGGAAELGDESDRYAFQGSMVFLDAATGEVLRKTWTIHPPVGEPGGFDDDFAGGTIWSTPAVAPELGRAYVGVGNPFKPWAEHPYTNAVVAYDIDRESPTWGEIVGSYKGNVDEYFPGLSEMPCTDIEGNPPPWYPQGGGSCTDIDLDFGASPNLFADPSDPERLLVGAGQKSGVYHAFDAETFDPAWNSIVGPPTPVGGIVGSTAHDGTAIYGPVTVPGHLWSVGLDGAPRWISVIGDGVHWGNPVSVANGVVYTTDFTGALDAFDAATGVPLLRRPLLLGSDIGPNPALSWGGVSVARNTVYAAVGMQGLPDGYVVALRPGGSGSGEAPGTPSLPAPPQVPGLGAGGVALAGPLGAATQYATPVVVVPSGSPVTFTNLDVALHDFDSSTGAWSDRPLIGLGESDRIDEIATLPSGQYEFFCSIHRNMVGTLVVA